MLFPLLLVVVEIFHVHQINLLQDDQLLIVVFEQYVQSIRHVFQPNYYMIYKVKKILKFKSFTFVHCHLTSLSFAESILIRFSYVCSRVWAFSSFASNDFRLLPTILNSLSNSAALLFKKQKLSSFTIEINEQQTFHFSKHVLRHVQDQLQAWQFFEPSLKNFQFIKKN